MPPVRQALGIITFSTKGSGRVWLMCAFRTPGSTTLDRENRLIHINEQMPCLYIITGAYHHPRRDPPSPIAHHPFLCYHTTISTRGEYSPELSISILSVCSIIEKRPRDSRSLRDLSIQHSLSSPRKPNYDLFGYYILLIPLLKLAPAECQTQIRSNLICRSRESGQ